MLAFRYLEAELQKAGLADLPVSAGDVLFVVARQKVLEMGELSQALRKDPSTIANVVKDLERRGYVRRERDPEDRRRVRVSLSPKARKAVPVFYRISRRFNQRFLRGVAAEQRQELVQLLDRLMDNLS